MMKSITFVSFLLLSWIAVSQQSSNNPERQQWFMDAGFGMFIHWSLDSQLGAVISHSMAGASDDYLERFVLELVEYKEGFDAKIYFQSTKMGLLISAVNGHRLYTNNQWPNPIVLKIENFRYRPIDEFQVKSSSLDGAK